MWPIYREVVEDVYKHPKVREIYASDSDQKFDIVIAEVFNSPGLYALAHRFNAPLIGKNNDIYQIIIQKLHLKFILH